MVIEDSFNRGIEIELHKMVIEDSFNRGIDIEEYNSFFIKWIERDH